MNVYYGICGPWWRPFLKKKLDTIEDPQNNHTIGEQVCSWDYHLEKMFGCNV